MITDAGKHLTEHGAQLEKTAFGLRPPKLTGALSRTGAGRQFGKRMREEAGPLGAASSAFGIMSGTDSLGGAATGMVGGALGSMASEAGVSGVKRLAGKLAGSKVLQVVGNALPGPLKWVGRGIGTGLGMAVPMISNMVGYDAARAVGNKYAPIWKRRDPKSLASGYISQRDLGVQRKKL